MQILLILVYISTSLWIKAVAVVLGRSRNGWTGAMVAGPGLSACWAFFCGSHDKTPSIKNDVVQSRLWQADSLGSCWSGEPQFCNISH